MISDVIVPKNSKNEEGDGNGDATIKKEVDVKLKLADKCKLCARSQAGQGPWVTGPLTWLASEPTYLGSLVVKKERARSRLDEKVAII